MARRRIYITEEQKQEAHRAASRRHYQKKKHGITKADSLSAEAKEALLRAFRNPTENVPNPWSDNE
jgi:hypothetical protein